MTSKEVSRAYFIDTNWLFIGSLMIAVGIENSGLHKRIALRLLILIGTSPQRLMAGFMATSFLMSMWISNAAAVAMILPVVNALMGELKEREISRFRENRMNGTQEAPEPDHDINGHENPAIEMDNLEDRSSNVDFQHTPPADVTQVTLRPDAAEEVITNRMEYMSQGVAVAVTYAATIGGLCTITGTPTNSVFAGLYEELYPQTTQDMTYVAWMTFGVPVALVFVILAYFWLTWLYVKSGLCGLKTSFTCSGKTQDELLTEAVIRNEYTKLGSMRWEEGTVLLVFILTGLLWFFRKPGFMPGWGQIFNGHVSDAAVAVTMSFLLFILPRERPEFLCRSRGKKFMNPVKPIMDWATMQRKFSWRVPLLLGGGFALATGSTESGLSRWVGQQLVFLVGLQPWLVVLIISIIMSVLTEFANNTALATIFVPILAQLSQVLQIHPLYILIPAVLSSSFAFMLPSGSATNAIAFTFGHLKVLDLVKAGWMMNIIGLLVLTTFINTFGKSFFQLASFPDWAILSTNITLSALPINNSSSR
ncbi:Na(+)/citrate cotransporter-like [Ciona intestinalis]